MALQGLHGQHCLCQQCITADHNASVQNTLLQQMYNSANSSLANAVLGGVGYASQSQSAAFDRYTAQNYFQYASTRPIDTTITPYETEARIDTFVVGKLPAAIRITSEKCYLDFEDLPPHLKEPAVLLHAGSDLNRDNPMFKLKGVGSVRLFNEVLYFRVFI